MSKETFDIMKETSYYELLVTLLDNTGDEYPQMGVGQDENGVYVVDLSVEDPETLREKKYTTPGMRVMDVVKAGVKHHVFEEKSSDDVRYRKDAPLLSEWKAFYEEVLVTANQCTTGSIPELEEELEEFTTNYEN